MHNWDGTALIPQGNKRQAEYYLFGIKHTKDEWLDKKKSVNGVPFYKTSIGKTAGARVYNIRTCKVLFLVFGYGRKKRKTKRTTPTRKIK